MQILQFYYIKKIVGIANFTYNQRQNILIINFLYLVPGLVSGVKAQQWGSSAIFLMWQPPAGVLTGYEISYERMNQHRIGEEVKLNLTYADPNQNTAILASLEPATDYRIYIKAINKAGVGDPYVHIF